MTNGPEENFVCNVCSHTHFSRTVTRGDGRRVLFCENCGMGVIEAPPVDTSVFYADGYYGREHDDDIGYVDYAFTAEHGLLWVKLMVEMLKPQGRVLDIGCADGFLLRKLGDAYEQFGIEVNAKAAAKAAASGVQMIAEDIFEPTVKENFHGSFDVVTSIATFEHVLDLQAAFVAAQEVLKPDGVLIFEIPLISETRDNHDWFNGSYEHIYYPTISGLEHLFSHFTDFSFTGFESDIKGYGSTYIGAATRDRQLFSKIEHAFKAMTQVDLQGLSDPEKVLNLGYNVVHSFRQTPERVLALPLLIDKAYSVALVTRLTQLWHSDSLNAVNAEWYEGQAKNWQAACEELRNAKEWHEGQAKNWQAAFEELRDATSGNQGGQP
jgi:SAM-dependent methyltransferase